MSDRGGCHNFLWVSQAAAGGLILFLLLTGCTVPPKTYCLLPDSDLEITVYVREGQTEGAVIYIVGGTHGDETAGWQAALALHRAEIEAGTLYVAAPLNVYGAEHDQRKTREERDINRNFPGSPEGCDAEQIAWAVFEDIRDKRPDLVLDLHEAHPDDGIRDALGNSIICRDLQPIEDLALDLLEQIEPLTLYGSPPAGSLNRVVTEELGIPVITIETDRGDALTERVQKQLVIVGFILNWYGLEGEST